MEAGMMIMNIKLDGCHLDYHFPEMISSLKSRDTAWCGQNIVAWA